MAVAEQNDQYRSTGYGEGKQLNDAQQAGNQAAQQANAQAQPLQQAPQQPPPQVQGPLPPQEKPGPPNEVALNDGTVLNLDQVLFSPTQRPGEPVTTPIGAPTQPKLSELFQAMADSSPAADIAGMADLAKRLGL